MPGEPVYVFALGASTPVGRNAFDTAAAVRAGLSGIQEHPYMIDAIGEPMRAAMAPWLDTDLSGIERFAALLNPVVDQVLGPLEPFAANSIRVAVALSLPNSRPGVPEDLEQELVKQLITRYGSRFSAVAVFPNGHAAGLLALDAAARKLGAADLDACVMAGVDSYVNPHSLEWLEACDQLHGAGPSNNAWGFIPGEAAGGVLLVRAGIADKLGGEPLARVLGVGIAIEPNRIKTETVCIGQGLTQAFRIALSALPAGTRVTDVYCDMNGEPYRADEYGFACLRTRESFQSMSEFVAPADCWGDVSAAGAPLHIVLAAIAGRKGYASGASAFVWASSEGGERGAAVLAVPYGN